MPSVDLHTPPAPQANTEGTRDHQLPADAQAPPGPMSTDDIRAAILDQPETPAATVAPPHH